MIGVLVWWAVPVRFIRLPVLGSGMKPGGVYFCTLYVVNHEEPALNWGTWYPKIQRKAQRLEYLMLFQEVMWPFAGARGSFCNRGQTRPILGNTQDRPVHDSADH